MEKYKRGDSGTFIQEKMNTDLRNISCSSVESNVFYNGAWTTQLTGSSSKVSMQHMTNKLLEKLRPISNGL